MTCTFKRGTRRLPPTESILEVNSFETTSASERHPVARVAEELKRIADVASQLGLGFRPLAVVVKEMPEAPPAEVAERET